MTKDEAIKLALEALEKDPAPLNAINNAKCFLYSALEQPEQFFYGQDPNVLPAPALRQALDAIIRARMK